jgi:hypothetical protein
MKSARWLSVAEDSLSLWAVPNVLYTGDAHMEIKQEIFQLKDELIELRRDFHQHPELGLEELRTSGKVEAYLEEIGLEVSRVAKTGVVGLRKWVLAFSR